MAAAAITPRVRILALCDEVLPSDLEIDVFTLEAVRQHVIAERFPWLCRLCVYLLLSSARKGNYPSKLLVVDNNHPERRVVRYLKHSVVFREDNEHLAHILAIENIAFPQAGHYTFEVWFEARDGTEALKGEHPFRVLENEA